MPKELIRRRKDNPNVLAIRKIRNGLVIIEGQWNSRNTACLIVE